MTAIAKCDDAASVLTGSEGHRCPQCTPSYCGLASPNMNFPLGKFFKKIIPQLANLPDRVNLLDKPVDLMLFSRSGNKNGETG
jgi:hypothetical protein